MRRYLSAEPYLLRPKYLRRTAMRGKGVPTYSYAWNNPLRYTDRTGLFGEGVAEFPWWQVPPLAGAAVAAAGEATVAVGGLAVAAGAMGLTGMVVTVGPGQFPDPGAGVPFPRPRPRPLPYFPGEPGIPAAGAAAAAGALVCMASATKVSCPAIRDAVEEACHADWTDLFVPGTDKWKEAAQSCIDLGAEAYRECVKAGGHP